MKINLNLKLATSIMALAVLSGPFNPAAAAEQPENTTTLATQKQTSTVHLDAIGGYVKNRVEEVVTNGPTITQLTGGFAQMNGTQTLTSLTLNAVLPEDSPLRDPSLELKDAIGDTGKRVVERLPGGTYVTAVTGAFAQAYLGEKTIGAAVFNKIWGPTPTAETKDENVNK